ncbi:MAG: hypothetical protein K8Q99_06780 [Acholeplasmataceae bacterium]|nr:hypothetical protein [Acholeplasmataceae bacterium]
MYTDKLKLKRLFQKDISKEIYSDKNQFVFIINDYHKNLVDLLSYTYDMNMLTAYHLNKKKIYSNSECLYDKFIISLTDLFIISEALNFLVHDTILAIILFNVMNKDLIVYQEMMKSLDQRIIYSFVPQEFDLYQKNLMTDDFIEEISNHYIIWFKHENINDLKTYTFKHCLYFYGNMEDTFEQFL